MVINQSVYLETTRNLPLHQAREQAFTGCCEQRYAQVASDRLRHLLLDCATCSDRLMRNGAA